MQAPIIQNNAYHNFVDNRVVFGHPNFFDCLSNIFFIVISFVGIKFCSKNSLSLSWKAFFISVGLVGLGSYYYHFNPNSQTLVWDRLPMTLAFMSLITAVFCETFNLNKEKLILFITNFIGILSVVVWVMTEDLRLYYWVQLTPILSLLIIGLFFSKTLNAKYMLTAFALYVLAKVTEHSDSIIYNALGLSGHTIKHILAAVSIYCLYLMKKKPRSSTVL
jgi:hypothetical protein